MLTPATLPSNMRVTSTTPSSFKSSIPTDTAEPANDFLLILSYPVAMTSTSLRIFESSSRIRLITVWFCTLTSVVFFPTKLKTSTFPFLVLMEYFPSKSVSVPLVLPLTSMVTPGKGPVWSLTTPLIVIPSCP